MTSTVKIQSTFRSRIIHPELRVLFKRKTLRNPKPTQISNPLNNWTSQKFVWNERFRQWRSKITLIDGLINSVIVFFLVRLCTRWKLYLRALWSWNQLAYVIIELDSSSLTFSSHLFDSSKWWGHTEVKWWGRNFFSNTNFKNGLETTDSKKGVNKSLDESLTNRNTNRWT